MWPVSPRWLEHGIFGIESRQRTVKVIEMANAVDLRLDIGKVSVWSNEAV